MYWLRLCWHFGILDYKEAQRRISPKKFKEWLAFMKLEDPEWRADLRAGIIASTIANVNRSKESDKIAKASDFMPFPPDFIEKSGSGSHAIKATDTTQLEAMFQARVEASKETAKKLGPAFDGHVCET